MAMFRLHIRPVTRSTGRTATAAAAYRAGERIRDERTGAQYDHAKRGDVLHKEIFLPSKYGESDARVDWARDRSTLWNAAEKAEQQSNSKVAREYQVALPAELSAEQRVVLARTFAREVAERYAVAVDLAIHAPRPDGDPRNFHAHLLATTRELTAEGLGSKAGIDMNNEARSERGLSPARQEFTTLRARWAELTNEALREAGLEARVDHRSLRAQGIDREPIPYLPRPVLAAERRGERTEVGERMRERYRRRVAAEKAREVRMDTAGPAARSADNAPGAAETAQEPRPVQDMDTRRRQAVQDWLKYRASIEQPGHQSESGVPPPLSMDEIRQQAVAAWRSLQARGAEGRHSAASGTARDPEHDTAQAGQAPDTPGLGDEFSG